MPNLRDKVALITGASSGIGAGTAIYFASIGCKIAINARNEQKLDNVRKQCIKIGLDESKVLMVLGDLNVEQDARNVVDKTVSYFGCLDILVNNAGIVRKTTILDDSMEEFDLVMSTNFRSPYRLVQMTLPYLIKSKGNIVNVSSIASTSNILETSAYCASKAALDHLTRNLALELAPNQVRVNCVNPGSVYSDILLNAGGTEEYREKFLESAAKAHPLGRVGNPEEVAKPIAFLASDHASFITGATLFADGGLSLKPPISL